MFGFEPLEGSREDQVWIWFTSVPVRRCIFRLTVRWSYPPPLYNRKPIWSLFCNLITQLFQYVIRRVLHVTSAFHYGFFSWECIPATPKAPYESPQTHLDFLHILPSKIKSLLINRFVLYLHWCLLRRIHELGTLITQLADLTGVYISWDKCYM